MKRKIALAFAGLLLMLTASSAPVSAPVPGSDIYVTMGGKVDGRIYLYINTYWPPSRVGLGLPMYAPFVTRAPFLSPMHLLQNITFSPPIDVDVDGTPDIIQITKVQINPIVHMAWIAFRGTYWRFTLFAPAPGGGVIFINPAMPGDVDCYTFNNDTGVYWDAPSPLAGQFAAFSGGHYDNTTGDFVPPLAARFPSPGMDGIPGTALWGDPADGFGDGVPDPKGSSILMLPLLLMGDEWNATAGVWTPTIAIPMPLVLTTGKAYDHVNEPDADLYSLSSLEEGMPWEFLSECVPWDHPKAFAKVVYVAAWSNLLYTLNPDDDGDGVPDPETGTGLYYYMDLFYEYEEKKVRQDSVIADINCDQTVDIVDLVIAGVAFGAHDEGNVTGTLYPVADANYDARADMDCNGLIDIVDVITIALDFGKTLTADCIVIN